MGILFLGKANLPSKWFSAVKKIDVKLLLVGLVLEIAGLIVPTFLTVENFKIYDMLALAIREQDKINVLLAGLRVVLLNTCRAVLHYLGAFFLAESIHDIKVGHWPVFSMVLICMLFPGAYAVFDGLYGIHLDFGIPTLSMISTLLIFLKIRFDFVNLVKKVLMLILLNASIQFLNIMPALHGLPFGRGEASYDIKLAAAFLYADGLLQSMAAICSVMLLFVAILLLILIVDENNIKRIGELREKSEQELMKAQIRILENRTYKELNHLVHDLKSPLTSMQALVGVIKLSWEQGLRGSEKEFQYLNQIEAGIDRMSGMISEILNENHFTVITTYEIITGLMSQISVTEYAHLVHVDNQIPNVKIEVNVTRFSRSLVNLIENSYFAVDPERGEICLKIFQTGSEQEPEVCFSVCDNGIGIAQELLSRIWVEGYSTRNSQGLGLSFVEKVVVQSRGTVEIESNRNQGTEVRIRVPVYEETA